MSVRFCVLGSGSEGNAALLMTPDFHILIDAGFLPHELAARMEGTGAGWETLDAVVLTHTHGDHIKKKCLTFCVKHDIQFVCHEHHAEQLSGGRYFKRLQERGLLRTYDGNGPFTLPFPAQTPQDADSSAAAQPSIRFFPIKLPHDCPPTFGFRIEARAPALPLEDANGAAPRWVKLGYLVDLGCCVDDVAREVLDVDLLALEFNHDEQLQLRSGRQTQVFSTRQECRGTIHNLL